MPGVMLVRQRVADITQWDKVFRDPELDAVRRAHGLVVTGTYIDGDNPDTVIVVMDMDSIERAREFAGSTQLWPPPANGSAPSVPLTAFGTGRKRSVDMEHPTEGVTPPFGVAATSSGVASLGASQVIGSGRSTACARRKADSRPRAQQA